MENIVGTWALIKTKAVDANGTPTKTAPFGGTDFIGRVVFTKEGRMSAAITDARGKIPEEESREYSCYAGAYTLKDSTLITKVDACSDPARMGTEQVRTVSFEDGIMVLKSLYAPMAINLLSSVHYGGKKSPTFDLFRLLSSVDLCL